MDSQELKKAFFAQEESFFGKKHKPYKNKHLRGITTIFSSIASQPNYKEIRKRYKVDKIISKILLPKQMHYVLYSFYRGGKLTIAVPNHIGQAELNMQKMTLIKYLKHVKDYADIQTVSIFRDESFLKQKKQNKNVVSEMTFKEKSYGIFENNISDDKLHKSIEDIRNLIIKSTVTI